MDRIGWLLTMVTLVMLGGCEQNTECLERFGCSSPCVDMAKVYGSLYERCGYSYDDGYDLWMETRIGFPCTCSDFVGVRDQESLEQDCIPWLLLVDCSVFEDGQLDPSCSKQILYEESCFDREPCVDIAMAYGMLFERCGYPFDEGYNLWMQEREGFGCTCQDYVGVRDEDLLYDQCIPWLVDAVECADFFNLGQNHSACTGQILYPETCFSSVQSRWSISSHPPVSAILARHRSASERPALRRLLPLPPKVPIPSTNGNCIRRLKGWEWVNL